MVKSLKRIDQGRDRLCPRCGYRGEPMRVRAWYFLGAIPAFLLHSVAGYLWFAFLLWLDHRCRGCRRARMRVNPVTPRLEPNERIHVWLHGKDGTMRSSFAVTARRIFVVDWLLEPAVEEMPWEDVIAVQVDNPDGEPALRIESNEDVLELTHVHSPLALAILRALLPQSVSAHPQSRLPQSLLAMIEGPAVDENAEPPEPQVEAPGPIEFVPLRPPKRVDSPAKGSLRRHWDGDNSLAYAYWVVGSLLGFAISKAGELLNLLDWSAYRLTAGMIIGYWILLLAFAIWSPVGTWRSATRYIRTGLGVFWPRVAQVMLVLGALMWAWVIPSVAIPQWKEHVSILFSDQSSLYTIRPLRDGLEIELKGGIAFGVADAFARVLASYPQAVTVHLSSDGGRISEARKLFDLIQRSKLDTYVPKYCASACTIVYSAGRTRLLKEGARLGFHQASFPGVSYAFMKSEDDADGRRFKQQGVTAAFVDKIHTLPADDMWHPSEYELTSSGLVHQMVSGFDLAWSEMDPATDDLKLESWLLTDKLMQVVHENAPKEFADVLKAVKHAVRRGSSQAELWNDVYRLLSIERMRRMPFVDPEIVLEFVALQQDILPGLLERSPHDCLAYANPVHWGRRNPHRWFNRELWWDNETNLSLTFQSGYEAHEKTPGDRLTKRLTFEDGTSLFSVGLGDSAERITAACRQWGTLYVGLQALETGDAVRAARVITARWSETLGQEGN